MTYPVLFRPAHAKEVIGVHRSTIYHWANKGLIKLRKHGRMTFVRTDEVLEMLDGLGDQLGDCQGQGKKSK